MKICEDYIQECYPNVSVIIKNKGNSGFYFKYENEFEYISKNTIIYYLTKHETNLRKKKLIALKIISE